MSDDRAKRLAQLKQAFDGGAIDVDTYRAAVAALDKETGMTAHVNGAGAVAQGGGVAAGAGGVAVGGNVTGNIYIGVPAPASGGPAQSPPRASGWNTSAVRDLISDAFSDQELTTLCFDHFRVVYEDFAGGMSKGDKLQRLLDHCERHDQVAQLVALVRDANPAQYARFAARLKP